MVFSVRLSGSGSKVMGIHYAYPAVSEYEEGFGIILPVIAANFAIWQEDNQDLSADAQGMSADVRQMEQLATAFWEAYLAGDAAELAQYLSADYGGRSGDIPGRPGWPCGGAGTAFGRKGAGRCRAAG